MLELLWREAVEEGFEAVDRNYGNIVLIFCEQLAVRFDVDLFECKLIVAASALDCGFGVFTEVAAGAGIDDYVGLHKLSSCQLIGKLGINTPPTILIFNSLCV